MESRMFYGTAYKAGNQIQLNVPKSAILALGINPRDELEVTIRKTGRVIESQRSPNQAHGYKKKEEKKDAEVPIL
jgi:hypothetical protein